MTRNRIQVLYSLLQGFYWMLFGVTIAFANSYLSGIGVGTDIIGLITASFAGLAALAQAILGKLADKKNKLNWRSILFGLLILRFISNLIVFYSPNKAISAIVFGLAVFCMHTMLPFVVSANFYYIERGLDLNFGLARGFGSLFFALMTYFLGDFVAKFGVEVILFAGFIFSVGFFIILILLPYDYEKDFTKDQEIDLDKSNFFKKYKNFSIVLIAFSLIMAVHNNINTFLLQVMQSVGAGNKEMGTALFIGALFEMPIMFGFSQVLKKFSTWKMLMVSALFFAIRVLIYIYSTSVVGIYIAQIFQLLSFALFISASVYYTEERMNKGDSQLGQSMNASAVTFGSVIGSLAGGFLIKNFSLTINLYVMVLAALLALFILYIKGK